MKYFMLTVMQRGKKRYERVQASNKILAVKSIKEEFPMILVLKSIEVSIPLGEQLNIFLLKIKEYFKVKILMYDKIATIRQIAVMTDAGIAMNDILKDISEHTDNEALKKIYKKINHDINAGKSMTESMNPYVDEFGHITIAMTKLGEQTGNFSEAYQKLADMLENLRNNTVKLKKALRSPMLTLISMAIAFIILMMLVVPKFKDIFSRFTTDLPLVTKILLKIEWVFSHYGLFILLVMSIVLALGKYAYKNKKIFKYHIDKILVHPRVYLIHKAIFLSTMHKYNLVLSELLKSGVSISDALDTAVDIVDNAYIKEKLLNVNIHIGYGMNLTEAFALTGLYENMTLQMIKAGEKSGQLDTILTKVTDYYEREFQHLIDNLSSYVEPVLMFFISGLVLLMALGIFMPMWDLGQVIN